jgi:hypothetical protein
VEDQREPAPPSRVTRLMQLDPERFYNEGFNAPSLSGWDIA